MRILPIINYMLVLGTKRLRKPTTWYIDGQNLLGHKGTTRDVASLTDKLQTVRHADSIVLVLDTKLDERLITAEGPIFTKVSLDKGQSADSYILQEVRRLRESVPTTRIEIVTADKQLRRALLRVKPVVRGVVNPVTFWKRYLPRLAGLKGFPGRDSNMEDDGEGEPEAA